MKYGKQLFGVAFGLLCLGLAVRQVDVSELPATLGRVEWRWLPLILLSITAEQILRGLRWQAVLHGRGVSLYHAWAGTILGYLFNNLFPARAGEIVRCVYLGRKEAVRASEAFGSVVVERFLDGVAVLTIVAYVMGHFPLPPVYHTGGWLALAFYLAVLCGMLLLVFCTGWFRTAVAFVSRPLAEPTRQRLQGWVDNLAGGMGLLRLPGPFLKALVLSFLAWSLSLVSGYLGLLLFGLGELGMPAAVLVIAMLSLGAMVPASPGNAGTFELCSVLALNGVLGIDRTVAFGYGLFTHLLGYLYILVLGLGILFFEDLSLRQIGREAGETPLSEGGGPPPG